MKTFLFFCFFGNHLNLGGKIVRISVKTFSFFFGDHLNLGGKIVRISVKTFFFFFFLFFFGDHLNLGGKIVRISDLGPKFTLNFGEDSRIFEGLGPPPIKNPGYAYGLGLSFLTILHDDWNPVMPKQFVTNPILLFLLEREIFVFF